MKVFGLLLLIWYVFWGIAIKPKSIPGILHGQLTVWILYAVLLLVFIACLHRSERESTTEQGTIPGPPFAFTWRGFALACAVATGVTTVSRLLLYRFALLQVLMMFSFYVIAGLLLFAGTLIYARGPRIPRPQTNTPPTA